MTNERWATLLIFVGAIGVLWRVPAFAAIGVIGLTVVIASHLLRQRALRNVHYTRRLNETRAFVGETVNVACRANNGGRLPVVSLIVRDEGPKGFVEADPQSGKPIDTDVSAGADMAQVLSLKPHAFASRTFHLSATRRGYFAFKPPTLNAIDLLGLSEIERVESLRDAVIVYPRVFTYDELSLPARQPMGELLSLRRFIEDPSRNVGARDYEPGDSFRQIHWKASAHRGELQTRVFEHTSEPTTTILVNVTTFPDDWFGVDVERFEWAVSVAASLAVWAHESECTIGLSSNGCTPNLPEALRVKPRRSPDQLVRVLESLALLNAFTAARFEEFLMSEQRHVAFGSTLIIVTPLVTPQIEMAVHRLHSLGKRMVFICVDRVAPDLSHLPCPAFHLPPNTEFAEWTQRYLENV
jgi:uncharacterized protein (DUF58 family)